MFVFIINNAVTVIVDAISVLIVDDAVVIIVDAICLLVDTKRVIFIDPIKFVVCAPGVVCCRQAARIGRWSEEIPCGRCAIADLEAEIGKG